MDLARRWLDSQKGTPSFARFDGHVVADAGLAADSAADILERPLPAALGRDSTPRAGLSITPVRSMPVHEELIVKGMLYQQRKEALQQKAIVEQMKNCRSPRISDKALELKHQQRFEERFKRQEQEKAEKNKYLIMKLEEADNPYNKFAFKPRISHRGSRAKSRVSMKDQHDQWNRRREERLESLRAQKIISELAEVRDTPDINPASQQLAHRRKEKAGLAGLSHIDAMIERDRLSKLAAWERSQQQLMASQPSPKITVHAATLDRNDDRDVFDRLYEQTFEADERRAALIRDRLQHEVTAPAITSAAGSQRRTRAIEDDLMQRHLDSLAVRERTVRDTLLQETQRHTPAVNPVSSAIASRLETTSRERLMMPRFQANADGSAASREPSSRSTSVTSTATAKEREFERQQIIERQEQRRQERLAVLQHQKEAREMAECTFAPHVHHVPISGDVGTIHDRSANWIKKREMKLEEQRAQRQGAELAGCTFLPARSPPPSVRRGDATSSIYADAPWGTEEFIDRQQKARQLQLERERRHTTGDSWTGSTTVPREFQLGRREGSAVRSLEPPVVPRHADPVSASYEDREFDLPPRQQFSAPLLNPFSVTRESAFNPVW